MEWILKAWRGEEKLWKVFWIYGIIFGIILAVINSVIASFLGTVVVIPYLVIRTIYSIFLMIAQWRCAFNTEWKIWGYVVRILTVLGVIGIIFSIAGGALIGKDIMKVAECNKEVQEYVAKGGKDTQGFNKQCIERKLKDKTSPSTISKVIDAPQVNITPSPTVVDKYKVSCEQNMRDYAQKNGVNPEQYIPQNHAYIEDYAQKNGVNPERYIAQNQAYIEQCIQYYKSQDATPNKN